MSFSVEVSRALEYDMIVSARVRSGLPSQNVPGRLVKEEDRGVLEERARNSNALLLAAAQPDATLADLGLIAVGEAQNTVVDLCRLRCRNDLVLGSTELAISASRIFRRATIP